MSALPNHDDNVVDIEEPLRQAYATLRDMDNQMHQHLARIRAQLVAHQLGRSEDIPSRYEAAEKELAFGDDPGALTPAQFEESYLQDL